MTKAIRALSLLPMLVTMAACEQGGNVIDEDGVYNGTLSLASPRLDDGSAYATYTIDLDTGEELNITMQSADFDAYVRVDDASGQPIGEDDDSAGGSNANLIVVAPSAGTYSIIANTFSAEEYGDFVLAIRRSMPENVGGVFSGVLQEVDGKSLSSNTYPTHDIAASAGETLDVHLTSGSFDTYVEVRDSSGNTIAEDDDGAGGTNSRVSVPIYDSGTYTVVVRSFDDGESGPYTLIVRNESAAEEGGNSRTERLRGELASWSDRLEDGTPYALHTIDAVAGEELDISMTSSAFDAYLQLWTEDEAVLAENDDSGGGLNSRITFIVPEDGRYVIVANSIGGDATGAYEINLRRTSIDALIESGEIEILSGMLSGNLNVLADGTPMSSHDIQASAGERFEITMTAGAFDAYLLVFDADEKKLSEDDDSGGGTNARLSFIAPEEGTYRIVANSYTSGASGAYTITVRRE